MRRNDPQATRNSGAAIVPVSAAWSDIDLQRVDVAARILACKQEPPEVDALLVAAVGEARRRGGELDAMRLIAALVRVSAGPAKEAGPGRRFAGLMAGLTDAEDVAALRGLARGGELTRPLGAAALRRIRRACLRAPLVEAVPEPLALLSGASWEALLEALARSLAVERAEEVAIEARLSGLDEDALVARRNWLRALLEQTPVAEPVAEPVALTRSIGERWPPPEREQLAAGHKVGRFTLLQRLGVGAMGVVYSAYDPELDRRIAVKLVRTRQQRGAARARARLVREAQAMARLSHPNVAVVHDVGTHEDDVFVAMEFIRGRTLQAWLREQPRGWAEVVEVFVQAGRGLAAAHAAGLVHRDFKPANAMIGDDGRVRVLDFGLCFAESSDTESSGEGRLDMRITRREEVVGTPAYMPPEQFMQGGAVGPASDQFSFCASLYEALYGQLPFAGETVQAVSMAIAGGELRPPPRGSRVPLWLASAVQRGLRPQANERFPTMEALLRVLGRTRSRARGGVAIAAALAIATGLVGFVAARSQALAVDPCSGGALEMAEVWSGAPREAAAQALLAAGPAYAEELWPPVASELDEYAASWQGMHREACLAHQRGETSGALLDRRMACLARRKAALAEAARVLGEADAEVALHALEVVEHLPGLSRCEDLVALADEAGAGDPALRAQADQLRPQLARARTLAHAGLTTAAVNQADSLLRAAEALGEPSLLSDVLVQRGRMAIDRREGPGPADELLTRGYLVALAARLDELAAEALALRLYVRGREAENPARALDELPVATAMVDRLAAPGRLRGLLLNNAGSVAWALGDAGRGAELFREALAVREATLGPDHLEVAYTLVNLAMVTGSDSERTPLMRRALAIFDARLGRAHPQTIEVRTSASLYAVDPREAQALIAPGCEALGRFSPDDRVGRARCLHRLGHHASEAGDAAAASAAFREVEELLAAPEPEGLAGPELVELRGRAALANGRLRVAATLLREALAEDTGAEWWQRRQRAELELQLGEVTQGLGQRGAAIDALRAAIVGFEAAATHSRTVLLQQRLASARVALASQLLAGHGGGEGQAEARTLLVAAEQFYRSSGPGYAWRLPGLEDLQGRRGIP